MGKRRTKIKVHLVDKPAMTVYRRILKKDKLVYLLVAPRPVKYPNGRSRIMYIGTTSKGVRRIAGSAAHRAQEILESWGLKQMDAHVVMCKARPGLPSWELLEEAILAQFRARYFKLPRCNKQGKKLTFSKKLKRFFRQDALDKVIDRFDATAI